MVDPTNNNPWNRPLAVDPNSAYYVHPSDANTSQLVSVKFNGTGYNNWKRSIMLSLSAKNELGFINGSIPKPVTTPVDYKAWERCNDLVCSWLLSNMDETISKSVLFFKTAREIWLDLEDRFGYASMTQVFSLEQQLSDLHQGSKSVSEFFTEIKAVWDAISDVDPLPCCTCHKCTCNVSQKVNQLKQDHRLLQFLMKLNDKYATVRGNILMQQPLPTLSNAFRLFSQEERHQELSLLTNQTESLAFVADNRRSFHDYGPQTNVKPGFNNSQRQNFGSGRGSGNIGSFQSGSKKCSNYFCTHCNVSGHSNERCFKLHGYPPNFKFKDKRMAALSVNNNSNQSNSAS